MEIITSWQQWKQWADEGWTMLPLIIKSNQGNTGLPSSWNKAWEMASPYSVVLESGKGGRFTYLGLTPASILEGKNHIARVLEPLGDSEGSLQEGDTLQGQPLEILEQWMSPFKSPSIEDSELPPFMGGCIGFLGYDVVRSLERLPILAEDVPGFPEVGDTLVKVGKAIILNPQTFRFPDWQDRPCIQRSLADQHCK